MLNRILTVLSIYLAANGRLLVKNIWKILGIAASVAAIAGSASFVAGTHAQAQSEGFAPQKNVANVTFPHGAGEAAIKKEPTDSPTWATSDFPINANGQTYGSDSGAETSAEMPDLIAVMADDGTQGFVLKTELLAAEGAPDSFKSPEAALAWQAELQEKGPPQIAVYDVSGVNRIGTFTLDLGADAQR